MRQITDLRLTPRRWAAAARYAVLVHRVDREAVADAGISIGGNRRLFIVNLIVLIHQVGPVPGTDHVELRTSRRRPPDRRLVGVSRVTPDAQITDTGWHLSAPMAEHPQIGEEKKPLSGGGTLRKRTKRARSTFGGP